MKILIIYMFRPGTHFRDSCNLQRSIVVFEDSAMDALLPLLGQYRKPELSHFSKHVHDGNGGPERGRQSDDFGLGAGECDFSLELGFPKDRYTRAKNDSKLVVKLTKTDYSVSQLLSFPGFWRYSLS